jgi:Flp pilus assembly protein TadG
MALIKRDQPRGQALVEFALVVPLLILLLMGIFDFGRAIYAFNTVNNAAREAVRLAIVDQNCTAVGQEAADRASSIAVDWTYDGLLSEAAACQSAASDVHIEFLEADYSGDGTFNDSCDPGQVDPNGPRLGCIAQVTVEYRYSAATPIIGNLIGNITLTGVSQQPIERTFVSP